MKAIIFSAGLGTRLKPYTNNTPKALVPLNGKPLLWHAIQAVAKAGISEVVINIHHFGQQIIDYVKANEFPISITFSDERDELLETGGALHKAKQLLQNHGSFLAMNVDVISSVDIEKVIACHQNHNPLATLVVRRRQTSRYLMFNEAMQLTGWQNISTSEQKVARLDFDQSTPYAFSGIQVISSRIFESMEETGKFSIIDLYLRLAKTEEIKGYLDQSDYWLDLGKPGQIEEAESILSR